MATETLPTTGAMALENYLFAPTATVGAVSEVVSRFPRANVADPRRSVHCRSTGTGDWSFDLDLGIERAPTLLALVDSNLGGSSIVVLNSLNAIGGTIGQTWTFAGYDAGHGDGSGGGGVLRFYLGNDDAAAAMTPSRYWRIKLNGSASATSDFDGDGVADTALRVGTLWLGPWVEMPFRPGARIDVVDPSRIVESVGGARFSDRQRIVRKISLDLDHTAIADVYDDWLAGFDSIGESQPMIVDLSAPSTSSTRKAHGCYYGTLETPSIGLDFAAYGTARLAFTEARA